MYGIVIQADVTRAKYVQICNALTKELKLPEDQQIVPEGITEGGFKIIGGSYSKTCIFNDGRLYKSVRHNIGNWPEIPIDVMLDWKDDNTILFNQNAIISFEPKVGKRTINWTQVEIDIIADVFDKHVNAQPRQ